MDSRVDEFEKILAGKNRPEMDQKLLPLLQLTPSLADYVQKNEKFVDRNAKYLTSNISVPGRGDAAENSLSSSINCSNGNHIF